ncbi:Imm42 family immunity protein [Achromobacter xylosoxidans]|uniref:Imm42 family immunity protein n=1 Tax=Alcaligenes xylosoxydans xylosoxydans TaxID=85698 RepID=UPI0009BF07D2|nr:Imm42 family immunity protein [Achromobacter xylosoxidans]MCH1990553.1 immunity 42 family protein [Achromobacter xylosoxidans]MCH1993985.1 immunity 42 family protein [Achromobacter xylosoxidans]MCH4588350.1 immunity 42 family protein [Achromobacter xylosoxidans]
MIYGDPFGFALQHDTVASWNSDENFWTHGVFFIHIDGRALGGIDVVELRTTLSFYERTGNMEFMCIESSLRFREIYDLGMNYFYGSEEAPFGAVYDLTCTSFGDRGIFIFYAKTTQNDVVVWSEDEGKTVHGKILPLGTVLAVLRELPGGLN